MIPEFHPRTKVALRSCYPLSSSSVHSNRLPLCLFSTCACCNQQNHYRTLGLKQNATAVQIKSKFYELSRTHHPDMNPGVSDSADRFKQISEAYTVLSDHNLRKQYDQSIATSYSPYASGTYASMSADFSPGNTARRQNANYAWSTRRSRTNARNDPSGRRDPLSGKSPTEEFSATLNRFERLARRKKSAAGAASSSRSSSDPWMSPGEPATPRTDIPKTSAAVQTIQLTFMLSIIFWIGSKFQM